jgi:cytoskeletal protein RodZ
MEDKVIKTEKSIGKYLKSVREEKELVLSKIARKTCISEKILIDIENDKFDDLGGLGYAKAMTMTYAKAVGANEKLVLHMFNGKYVKPVPRTLYKREQQPKKFMIPTSLFSILLLIILIVVLTLVITKLYKSGDLAFPFRGKAESTQMEKSNILKQPVKNNKSIYDSLEEEKSKEQAEKTDLNEVKTVSIDISSLRDSTDYADKYLFKGKDSPFNVKE